MKSDLTGFRLVGATDTWFRAGLSVYRLEENRIRENLYWLEKSYDTDFELGKIAGKIADEGNGQTICLGPSHQKKFAKSEEIQG